MLAICSSCGIRKSNYRAGDPTMCLHCNNGTLVPQTSLWSITCADCGHVMTNEVYEQYKTMRCGCQCHGNKPTTEAPRETEQQPVERHPVMPPKLKPSKAAQHEAKGARPTKRSRR